MTLIQYIKEGNAVNASAVIEAALKTKTRSVINETRKFVAAEAFTEQIAEAESEETPIDHTTNPYHDILTKHGFVHAGSKAEKNRLAPDKHEYVEHVYTHPAHGKSHVVVTQDTKYTGYKGSDYKPHSFIHRHEQDNGIMAPGTGDSKPQLHRSLSYHYGVPKGMEAPKLTAWEKKYPHGAPHYKMNEAEDKYPDGWHKVPSQRFPGEHNKACPKCGSTNWMMTVRPKGPGTGHKGAWRMGDPAGDVTACKDCKHTSDGSGYSPSWDGIDHKTGKPFKKK